MILMQVKSKFRHDITNKIKNLRQFGDQKQISGQYQKQLQKNFTITKAENTVSIIDEAVDGITGRPGPVLLKFL